MICYLKQTVCHGLVQMSLLRSKEVLLGDMWLSLKMSSMARTQLAVWRLSFSWCTMILLPLIGQQLLIMMMLSNNGQSKVFTYKNQYLLCLLQGLEIHFRSMQSPETLFSSLQRPIWSLHTGPLDFHHQCLGYQRQPPRCLMGPLCWCMLGIHCLVLHCIPNFSLLFQFTKTYCLPNL